MSEPIVIDPALPQEQLWADLDVLISRLILRAEAEESDHFAIGLCQTLEDGFALATESHCGILARKSRPAHAEF